MTCILSAPSHQYMNTPHNKRVYSRKAGRKSTPQTLPNYLNLRTRHKSLSTNSKSVLKHHHHRWLLKIRIFIKGAIVDISPICIDMPFSRSKLQWLQSWCHHERENNIMRCLLSIVSFTMYGSSRRLITYVYNHILTHCWFASISCGACLTRN